MNTRFRIFVVAAVAVAFMTVSPNAYACPDYIMSCYDAGKNKTQTTCRTYRDYDGSLVTKCTSN